MPCQQSISLQVFRLSQHYIFLAGRLLIHLMSLFCVQSPFTQFTQSTSPQSLEKSTQAENNNNKQLWKIGFATVFAYQSSLVLAVAFKSEAIRV